MEMTDFPEFAKARLERMRRANPKYVLRNYLAQQAIEALEQGDDSVITRLMEVLKRPYDEQPEHDELADRRPEWARHKAGCSALSCSS
jgi:serine/tyrosine/threonine adenylyltransferase